MSKHVKSVRLWDKEDKVKIGVKKRISHHNNKPDIPQALSPTLVSETKFNMYTVMYIATSSCSPCFLKVNSFNNILSLACQDIWLDCRTRPQWLLLLYYMNLETFTQRKHSLKKKIQYSNHSDMRNSRRVQCWDNLCNINY